MLQRKNEACSHRNVWYNTHIQQCNDRTLQLPSSMELNTLSEACCNITFSATTNPTPSTIGLAFSQKYGLLWLEWMNTGIWVHTRGLLTKALSFLGYNFRTWEMLCSISESSFAIALRNSPSPSSPSTSYYSFYAMISCLLSMGRFSLRRITTPLCSSASSSLI